MLVFWPCLMASLASDVLPHGGISPESSVVQAARILKEINPRPSDHAEAHP